MHLRNYFWVFGTKKQDGAHGFYTKNVFREETIEKILGEFKKHEISEQESPAIWERNGVCYDIRIFFVGYWTAIALGRATTISSYLAHFAIKTWNSQLFFYYIVSFVRPFSHGLLITFSQARRRQRIEELRKVDEGSGQRIWIRPCLFAFPIFLYKMMWKERMLFQTFM